MYMSLRSVRSLTIRQSVAIVAPLVRHASISTIPDTISGNAGLKINEPLLFEQDVEGRTAVLLPQIPQAQNSLGAAERKEKIGLPGVAENQIMRHYVRLSQKNYGIDSGVYPLGSCTMKYNPRVNEVACRLPGFADVHPLQPEQTVQGVLEMIYTMNQWLMKITGMAACTPVPAAGAHGELAGVMAIQRAQAAKGQAHRRILLVPESAHGTNPATGALSGYTIQVVKGLPSGLIDMDDFKKHLNKDVAGMMVTNPNTCGLFESDIMNLSKALHDNGSFLYMDGANLNALLGRVHVSDLGVDAMHINLHKTFATPHGGGGPGAGPVVFSKALAPFAPLPQIVKKDNQFKNDPVTKQSMGRVKGFNGQVGVMIRALAYMFAMGAEGLKMSSGDAVLNANYVLTKLRDTMTPAYGAKRCMHEALFEDAFLKGTGISTMDIAKLMIDEGLHPMTVYFPMVVHGAFLMEPTESESKAALDQFCDIMKSWASKAVAPGDKARFHDAPIYAPIRRVDEALASKTPILRWKQ